MQIRDDLTDFVEILQNAAEDAILAMEESINLVSLDRAWGAYRTVAQIGDQVERLHPDVCVLTREIVTDAIEAYDEKLNDFLTEEKEAEDAISK